jgi:hypothetical protein
LVTATNSVEQSTKLLALASDLARYKHISLAAASKILARGTQGAARAFKEMGITLDTSLPKNQAIAKAFDELNKKIGGQAQAYTKSFAGQMDILKERMDNVFQTVSAKVLPVLAAFISYLTTNGKAILIYGTIVLSVIAVIKTYGATMAAIKGIQQAYAFWTYAQAASTNVFKFAMYGLNAAIKANPIGFLVTGLIALGAAFVWAWNRFEWWRKGVVKGIQVVVNAFGYLVGMIATALKALGHLPGFGWAKKAGEQMDKAAESVRNYSNSLDKLSDKKIKPPALLGGVAPGDKTGIKGNTPNGADAKGLSSGGGGGSTTVQNITVYASNTNDIEKKMAKAAKLGVPVGAK